MDNRVRLSSKKYYSWQMQIAISRIEHQCELGIDVIWQKRVVYCINCQAR